MAYSKSSKRWLKEHFEDTYVKRAQKEGLRARSAYKLSEINERYKFIKQGMTVVDLGAAPGSWSEYARKIVGAKGKVIAVDILPMQPVADIICLQGDFTKEAIVEKLSKLVVARSVDVVLSDMAPNTTGIREVDQARSLELVLAAFGFALKVLKVQGAFLAKAFQSGELAGFIKEMRMHFREVKIIKPKASRARSQELFLLGSDFRGI